MQHDLHEEQPLHQVLLSWLPWMSKKTPEKAAKLIQTSNDIADRMKISTVQQIVTSLRMQGIASEDDHMLSSLESLVLAGEIQFPDFIGRIQNLFPKAIDEFDKSMRLKITALMG